MLTSLLYVSAATRPFGQVELAELLQTSRHNNAPLGVTGLLLHFGGNFMQALEGGEDAVYRVFDKIKTDPRHRNVKKIVALPSDKRLFPEWAMGFKEVNELPPEMRGSISSFIDDVHDRHHEMVARSGDHPVLRLLDSFVLSMR